MKTTLITIVMLAVLPVLLFASVDLVIPETWVAEGYQYNMTLFAQVLRADGTPIDHERSVLAVFDAQGRCRGAISPVDGPNGRLFLLGIASNQSKESGLILKVLDAVSGETYLVQETVDFVSDAQVPENGIIWPLVLHVSGRDTALTLEPGWNLVSLVRPVTAGSIGQLLAASPLRMQAGAVRCTTVDDIKLGIGYWVFTKDRKRIELMPDLSQTAGKDIALAKGWNLVGTSREVPEWLPMAKKMYIWEAGLYLLINKPVPGLGMWVYRE